MWIVRLALARPYTFVVMALLISIVGVMTIIRMPKDIFPDIDIPVISVVWNYAGLPPEDMEQRIVTNYERALTTTVNDIEHVESQSLAGLSVIKIFFQPGAHIEAATAQVTAISQTVLRQVPAGTTPPFIIRYSASNVPIMQAALESDSLSEQQLFDYGTNFVRADMAMVPGVQNSLALWGQTATCRRRYRSRATLRVGPLAAGRDQCGLGPKSRFADGYGKNGVERISDCAQFQS